MFIDYIKEKFVEEYDLVCKLINIDEKVQGIKFDISSIKDIKSSKLINNVYKDSVFVLDGNISSLLMLINQVIGYNNKIIVNRNNLAFNKWIVKKYHEYCDIFSIDNRLDIIFSNVFNECKGKYVVIGSKAFILEYKNMLIQFYEGIIFE